MAISACLYSNGLILRDVVNSCIELIPISANPNKTVAVTKDRKTPSCFAFPWSISAGSVLATNCHKYVIPPTN